ncbi:Protein tyrosine phosphatase type IVA 1 [Nowakowskiella sp. JEL0078]|nr:Protein tyrosine phosphatase type IVA 1 [Nowakowskiella sp. JEL0078]
MSTLIANPTSPFNFVILDCPSDETLPSYLPILQENNVSHLIRLTEHEMYNPQPLRELGIIINDDLYFEDGSYPSEVLISQFRLFLDNILESQNPNKPSIAVHCISGIGRAPLLVAIALIDSGIDSLDVIDYIRKLRRGSFNKKQLQWLTDSKNGFRKRKGRKGVGDNGGLIGGMFAKFGLKAK